MQQSSPGDLKTLMPEVAYKAKTEQTLETILSAHGLNYHSAAEVPPKIMREIQRRPLFKDFRSIELPAITIRNSLKRPILKDLLVTRTGSSAHAAGHYIPRPEGSLDCILHYCVAGKGWCEIAGRRWDVTEGNILLLPAKTPHKYGASKDAPWSFHWIHFTGNMALEFCRLLDISDQQPLFQLSTNHEILACFDELYEWMGMVHNYDHLVAASGSLAHFLTMANIKRNSINQRIRIAEERIHETVRFMKENIEDHLSLKDLAKVAHMSPGHYCTVFKKQNGYSPIEYFQRLKVQKACDLLTQTALQVRQIASVLGFEDPFHFSRLFKRFIGVSPVQYRKRL